MQVPVNKAPAVHLLASALAIGLFLLLAVAASAGAETAPTASEVSPVQAPVEAEVPAAAAAPVVTVPTSSEASVPSAVEAVTDTVQSAAVAAEDEPAAPSTDTSNAPSSPAAESLRTVSKAVSAATSSDEETAVSGNAERDALATAGATELTGRTLRETAENGGPLFDRVGDSPLSAPVDRVREAADSARILALAAPVTESIRALSELTNLTSVDTLLATAIDDTLPAEGMLPVTGSTSPLPGVQGLSPPSLPSSGQGLAGMTLASEDSPAATNVAPSFLLESVVDELSRLSLSGGHRWADGQLLPAVTDDGYSGAVQRSGGRSPAEVPLPAPGSSEAATGFSGTTFIPLVALLALLALAAPATGRRLREALDVRAPVPFVCALERPG